MKSAIVSVACYSNKFSKVFINSFRKYYPKHSLVIVDNNFSTILGEQETKYLKQRAKAGDIIYVSNERGKSKKHGEGLDVGLQYLHKNKYDLMINVDIDSLFRKRGVIEACEEAHAEGYKYGGSWHLRYARSPHKRKSWEDYHVHSSFGFYDILTLIELGVSFIVVRGKYETGEKISYTLRDMGLESKPVHQIAGIEHFAAGTLMREGGIIWHSRANDPVWEKKYLKKQETFFEREDVKPFLED